MTTSVNPKQSTEMARRLQSLRAILFLDSTYDFGRTAMFIGTVIV